MTATAPIPQGPGVTAPFPAPPAEGGGTRIGWGLAVAGLFLVLCCGGGAAALVGFLVTQVAATDEQSRAVVSDYLDALREDDYETAYDLLCDERQEEMTLDEFETFQRRSGQVEGYEVGELDLNDLSVPVTEHYEDGTSDEVTYFLAQDQSTAQLEICGRE